MLVLRTVLLAHGTMGAAINLHKSLLEVISKAKMCFFETTEVGHIINRFSVDVQALDGKLVTELDAVIFDIYSITTVLVLMTLTVWWFPVVLIPICFVFYKLQRKYLPIANDLQRSSSISTGSIYTEFSEFLSGITTIRVFAKKELYLEKMKSKLHRASQLDYLLVWSQRWFLTRANVLGNFLTLIAVLLVIYIRPGAAWSALVVTYLLQFRQNFTRLLTHASSFENSLVSVERINEYRNVEREVCCSKEEVDGREVCEKKCDAEKIQVKSKTDKIEGNEADFSVWMKDCYVGYRENLILHGISLKIKSGEKIAIVGRTGSGKSTLITALLKFIEPVRGEIQCVQKFVSDCLMLVIFEVLE